MKTGENFEGWVLRAVHGREAAFEKAPLQAQLSLPSPDDQGAPPLQFQVPVACRRRCSRSRSDLRSTRRAEHGWMVTANDRSRRNASGGLALPLHCDIGTFCYNLPLAGFILIGIAREKSHAFVDWGKPIPAELAYNRGDVVLRNMPEVLGIESTNHCNIKCIDVPARRAGT